MSLPPPPIADRRPQEREIHGQTVVDEYAWLRDREDARVHTYLGAENDYTEAVLSERTGGLRSTLFEEMKGRIREDDRSVPVKDGDYWYYSRIGKGQQYWTHCRRKGSMEGTEEVLLDENLVAADHEYLAVDGWAVSPDHQLLAYGMDTSGDERYEVYVKDLASGELLTDRLAGVGASLAWANDNQTLFYDRLDDAHRPFKIFRHTLGAPSSEDVEVFHEADERFFIGVGRTRSDAYLTISCSSQVTGEVWVLPAGEAHGAFRCVTKRRQGIEYDLVHHKSANEDRFFILSNDAGPNFRLCECPAEKSEAEHWREVIPHRGHVFLEAMECFSDHLVLDERENGLVRVRIRRLSDGEEHHVDFADPAYAVYGGSNPEFDSTTLRYGYSSLATPDSVFAYDMNSKTQVCLKELEVVGGYERSDFHCERIWAESHDGARVPISLVWRGDSNIRGARPTVLYAYGAYGSSTDATFSRSRLSLLDRGVLYAIAHVRGGADLGRDWYEHGKGAEKKNTFLDFIAAAEHLVKEGIAAPDKIAGTGGSAGGLLIGAVANLRPDLFRALVADVPFVDVVNTLLDATLPLTVVEWEEWGNPADPTDYAHIADYAPYENVVAREYPDMLVTAGLNDPRVGYWEPAKWVAKLRAHKTDDRLLLLHTNLDAGHAGASGRYQYLEEIAREYAFLLDRFELVENAG